MPTQEQELSEKVRGLVNRRFGGDYKRAVQHYSKRRGGVIDPDELLDLLKDAGIGNALTRSTWVRGIIDRFDKNHDGLISYTELQFLR